jgi:transcriptional adapter 3
MEYQPDDLMPYAMPSFGKYYVEKWEEEDYATTLALASDPSSFSSTLVHHYSSPLDPPPLPRLRPDHLTEEALGMENVFVGPLTERVVAALAFGCEEDRSQLANSEMRGKDASGDARGEKEERKAIDAVELEERIKKELRFIGILGEDEVCVPCYLLLVIRRGPDGIFNNRSNYY